MILMNEGFVYYYGTHMPMPKSISRETLINECHLSLDLQVKCSIGQQRQYENLDSLRPFVCHIHILLLINISAC
jgi:hypothetical protein